MKIFVLTIAIMITATFASSVGYSQTVNPAKIKFKGIGLDSTYSQVVKALGKPETEEPATEEGCIGGKEKSVKYPGISFYFMDGDSKDKKTFEVKAFELSAPNILVSGIKIGDTPATVKRKFGRKYSVDTERESGEITWLYAMNDRDGPGSTRVVFKNGKVSMIASDFLVC
jgi:hypothetical protein